MLLSWKLASFRSSRFCLCFPEGAATAAFLENRFFLPGRLRSLSRMARLFLTVSLSQQACLSMCSVAAVLKEEENFPFSPARSISVRLVSSRCRAALAIRSSIFHSRRFFATFSFALLFTSHCSCCELSVLILIFHVTETLCQWQLLYSDWSGIHIYRTVDTEKNLLAPSTVAPD